MGDLPPTVEGFIDELPSSEKTLLLINRRGPTPLVDLLERAFDGQPVAIADKHLPEGTEDIVCLVDGGEVVATTSMRALEEAFLLVNVDRYRTGTRQLELGTFPDVLTGLDDVEFTLRGFPDSNKEKLLLVVISRFIEARALAAGAGELHTTFQRLSRLDDEYGTRTVYEWLAESDVETHLYGVRDDPTVVDGLDVRVHEGQSDEYRRSWVVVFTPPAGESESANGHVALVAVETGPNIWRGIWTYDPVQVTRINAYMNRRF